MKYLTVQIKPSLVFIDCSIKQLHSGHIVKRVYILGFYLFWNYHADLVLRAERTAFCAVEIIFFFSLSFRSQKQVSRLSIGCIRGCSCLCNSSLVQGEHEPLSRFTHISIAASSVGTPRRWLCSPVLFQSSQGTTESSKSHILMW